MRTIFENDKLLVPEGYYQIFGDTDIKNKDLYYIRPSDWYETAEGNFGKTVEKKQIASPSIVYIRKISDPTNQTPNFINGVLTPPDGWRIIGEKEYIEVGDYFYNNNDLNPKFVLTGDGGKGLTNVFVGYYYIRKISFKYIKFANEKSKELKNQITNMQNIDDLKTRLSNIENQYADLEIEREELKNQIKKLKGEQKIEAGDYIVALKGSMFGNDGECVSKDKIYKVTQVGNSDFRFLSNLNREDSWGKEKFRKATLAEIEKHLREKATQAGFVVGAKVRWDNSYSTFTIEKIDFFETEEEFHSDASYANISSKYILVVRGKSNSAEICDKLILVKDEVEVNGYKAEYFKDYIKFGCARISVKVFRDLNSMMGYYVDDGNRVIEGDIMIGKGKFNKEIITKLLNNHREKFGS